MVGRKESWALAFVAGVLVVAGLLIVFRPVDGGPVKATVTAPAESASASASSVAAVAWSRDQVREALPVAGDAGLDFRQVPVRRDEVRGLVKSAGVPLCNENGVSVGGDVQEYLFWQARPLVSEGAGNGFYTAGVTYGSAAEAERGFETLRAEVARCPRTRHEAALPSGGSMSADRNSPAISDQRWSPEPETELEGWRLLRVVEVLEHPASYRWKEPTVRKVIDYMQRGNVVVVQLLWQWGARDGSDAWTKGRADRLVEQVIRTLATAQAPTVTTTTQAPAPDEPVPAPEATAEEQGTPCDPVDGMGCAA